MELLTEVWQEFLIYFSIQGANRRWVLITTVLLGISSGVLGSFALLRRQSLLSDAMAHAALPGVCIAFLLTKQKDPLFFLIGATVTGLLGALLVLVITRYSRIKSDTAIGLVLSTFYGAGIVLLTIIQNYSSGNQAGLDTFLFGQTASLVRYDIYVIGTMCSILLILTFLFYKQFKLLTFDPAFGISIGVPIAFFNVLLTGLVVVTVMIGLQAVGVVLMVAMLIIPAAAARQWTDRLGAMIILAALIGAISGIIGSFCSVLINRMPTGPVMVVTASSILFLSIFVAPKRGLIPKWFRRKQNRYKVQRENILKIFYKIGEEKQHSSIQMSQLKQYLKIGSLCSWLAKLCRQKLLKRTTTDSWQLTELGRKQAQKIVRNHRLWELYLTSQLDIAIDHVHRDAEEIEHILAPAVVEDLVKLLDSPQVDPHGKQIPRYGE